MPADRCPGARPECAAPPAPAPLNDKEPPPCPWCGVAAIPIVGTDRTYYDWGCGSFKRGPEPYQSPACRLNVAEARVADLEAQCDRLGDADARIAELEAERDAALAGLAELEAIAAAERGLREAATDEALKAVAREAAVLEGARGALTWFGDPDDANATFEGMAHWFYTETGKLAPGKDEPAATATASSRQERRLAWDGWCRAKKRDIIAALSPSPRAVRLLLAEAKMGRLEDAWAQHFGGCSKCKYEVTTDDCERCEEGHALADAAHAATAAYRALRASDGEGEGKEADGDAR